MNLGLAGVNLGEGEVGCEEEDAKTDENPEVPPRMTPGVFEREVHISVAVDVRLAGDCSNDGTSLVLSGGSFITSTRGNEVRAGSLQGTKFIRQNRFVRVFDRLCATCEQPSYGDQKADLR